ncbi:cell wall-binding repeat-containing protein [Desulfosporosinus sp. OT]|uniref:cell wall-binding repeat-containing protein n=1 Tax=Desulfosporosinus sp. OT TaxID=913865 RepID=UPI000223A30F|nr:cell wall-binding repeat-containing protein [Desulfosporosinus sp. OT]EGW37800.1 cell wall binding repeat 2 family protein [Desulfosporosinus sp. OT]
MKKSKKALASLAIAGMLSMIPFNALAENAIPARIGGTAAAQTAVQIANQTGWTGTAILASSTSYGMVDALTAGPLATFLKAPILLQEAGNVLNPDTKAELTKLEVKTVYVTSGTAVISQAVLDQLTNMGIKVVPLGGSDRFETAVNIAKQMVALGANVNKVAVAYGWLNQDALSIASIASAQTEPILLTEKNTVPESVKAFLTTNPSVTATDLIGGTGVVSDGVKAQLPNATRQFGNTAYDTNLAVLKAFDSVLKYDHVFIANGETAIDALAGAPLAAQYNSGIVLTKGTANEGTKYVSSKLSVTSVVTALGGTAVVPEAVRAGVVYVAPVVPVVPSGGGGGGGGSSSSSVASVKNSTELANALDDKSITKIKFTANITKNLNITRSLSIDFGKYVLTGNVSFDHTHIGTSSLKGTAADSIIGNLTVDTENASFENNVSVSGNVSIADVEIGTWTESADGNTLIITDSDGAVITINGSPGSVTVSENAAGSLTINVNAEATINNITCNAPVNLKVAANAHVTSVVIGAKAGGSTVTNNGNLSSLATYAPLNLVANVAPGATSTAPGIEIAISGKEKDKVKPVTMGALKITDISSIDGATLIGDTLSFSFAKLTKDSGITVSKDAKASITIGNSGPIGDFDLKAGVNTNILTAPLPTNLNLAQTNMTAVFNAIKDLNSTDKEAILNTVDFAKVLELVQDADPDTQNAVFEQVGFSDFYKAIRNASPDLKSKIVDNMTAVINKSLEENSADFKTDVESIMVGVVGKMGLSGDQKNILLDFYSDDNTDVAALLKALNLSVEQKAALVDNLDYAKLFEAMMDDLTPETRAKMFKTVNFTDLFNAIKSANEAQKEQIYENILGTMDTIAADSGISRVDLLNALVFGADKKEAFFHFLRNLDGTTGDVTATVTLTDANSGSSTKTYTFIISE